MSGKGLSDKGYLISTTEICEIMGLSSRRIQQLVDEKAIVRASHGKYDLTASVRVYIEYEKAKLIEADTDLDKLREETLWTRARRKKTEAELGIITGNLHRAEDVENVVNAMNSMMMNLTQQFLLGLASPATDVVGIPY